jgi:antitoxin component YwqK of YwqJK toxin-antitoxin module
MKSGDVVRGGSRRWIFPLLALALLAGVGILLLNRTARPPAEVPPPTERSRNQLELREGRLFDGAESFSGLVLEHYDGGELKSRSVVSHGLLEGLSEGWHTNGVLQITEHYSNGVSHGLRTKFHLSGAKLSEATVVAGQIEGRYERWHENGRLAEQVQLTNGVPHGESRAFHPDGSLKARVRLDHGTVVEQQFWEPGEAR